MKLYYAAPLFTRAEKDFNTSIVETLRNEGFNVLFPQEFTSLIPKNVEFFKNAFESCLKHLAESDVVVAIVDGPDADSGTCFEMGYAFSKNIPIIAIRTDLRASEENGVNLMISQCTHLFMKNTTMTISELASQLVIMLNALPKKKQLKDKK
jgi:nucleoside 2-deoxyribosyltransferase